MPFRFYVALFRVMCFKNVSASGDSIPKPSAGALPLDPTGGLPSLDLLICPPPPIPPSRSAPVYFCYNMLAL